MASPRFFFSYARQDDEDGVLRALFEDIETRVAAYLGENLGGQGFIDVDIELGDEWPDALLGALCDTEIFVCLMSPRYFRRPFCGQEWWVFNQRLERHAAARGGQRAQRILPLLWQEPLGRPYPQLVTKLQYTFSADSGDEESAAAYACYERKGLHYIAERVKIAKYDSWYKLVVRAIARRMVEVIQADDGWAPLDPSTVPPLAEAPNAFVAGGAQPGAPTSSMRAAAGSSAPHGPASSSGPARSNPGGAIARLAALVGTREAHKAGPRASAASLYSNDPWGWRPRGGLEGQTLGLIATRSAIAAELRPEWLDVGADLLEHLRAAEARAEPVVVIVDPWSTEVPDQRPRFDELDRERLANYAVLVIWPDDEQTLENREALAQRLSEDAFHRRYMIGVSFPMHAEVEPGADPVEVVGQALARLEERLVVRRGPARRLPLGSLVQLPSVSATRPPEGRVASGPHRVASGPHRVASGPHRAPSGPIPRS